MGYKLFINKINNFLLSFFDLLASSMDEVKIQLWDKIRTKLSAALKLVINLPISVKYFVF